MTPTTLGHLCSQPWVTSWGLDEWSFNLDGDDDEGNPLHPGSDGSGLPGRSLVSAAVARWLVADPGQDASAVAAVFNLPLHLAGDTLSPEVVASDLVDAIMVWSSCVGGDVPVDMAAIVFRLPLEDVLAAVASHHWMFVWRVGGVSCIGHEGE